MASPSVLVNLQPERSSLPKRANSISPQTSAPILRQTRNTTIGFPQKTAKPETDKINTELVKLEYMSTSDAVSAIRQKYQPTASATEATKISQEKKDHPSDQSDPKDIFARGRKRESLTEQKALRLKIESVASKCPFANENLVKQALQSTNLDTLKAVKHLKVFSLLWLLGLNRFRLNDFIKYFLKTSARKLFKERISTPTMLLKFFKTKHYQSFICTYTHEQFMSIFIILLSSELPLTYLLVHWFPIFKVLIKNQSCEKMNSSVLIKM